MRSVASKDPAPPRLSVDPDDEITGATLVCRGGEVVNARVREAPGISLPGPKGSEP